MTKHPALLMIVTLWLLVCVSAPVLAVLPDEILKDQGLESRARSLSSELRCLVCQNQSIDDSEAPLARDLRLLIREQLQQKKTDDEVLDFVVERYGDYVLLKPPLNMRTLLLWSSPFLILLVGLAFLARPRRDRVVTSDTLSAAEESQLSHVLLGNADTKKSE